MSIMVVEQARSQQKIVKIDTIARFETKSLRNFLLVMQKKTDSLLDNVARLKKLVVLQEEFANSCGRTTNLCSLRAVSFLARKQLAEIFSGTGSFAKNGWLFWHT